MMQDSNEPLAYKWAHGLVDVCKLVTSVVHG